MNTITFSRQFITDAQGRQVGVILPIDDYKLVEPILRQHEQNYRNGIKEMEDEKLRQIEKAAHDPLFLADLQEVMQDFSHVDMEWWESKTSRRAHRYKAANANSKCFAISIGTMSVLGMRQCHKFNGKSLRNHGS